MTYLVDERDVQFSLFEFLKIGELTSLKSFADQNEDLYKMVLDQGLKFTRQEIDSLYISGDREGCHIKDGQVVIPKGYREAYKAYAQNGFIGIDVPTTYGGQGLPVFLAVSVSEFFTGANVAFSMYPGLTRGGGSSFRG